MTLGSLPRARSALFLLSFVAVTMATVAAFRLASAQRSTPPALGDPFTVYSAPGERREPAVAFDAGARRHLIVWADSSAGDIYGRIVGDQGAPIGPHFPISLASGEQASPVVAAGKGGEGFLVVWQDQRGEDWDIYGQRVSAGGRLLDTQGNPGADPVQNQPLVAEDGDQRTPAVAHSSDSEAYVVVWVAGDEGATVAGRLASAAGIPEGEPITIVEQQGTVAHPAVAYNPAAGEFLVVWQHQEVSLEARRLSNAGELEGQRRRIWGGLVQPYPVPVPDVVFNPATEEYLVVWDDDSDDNIYGARVSAEGGIQGDRLVISSAPQVQRRPRVGVHDAGYLVAWEDDRDADSRSLYGQFLSAAGALVNLEGTPGAPADENIPLVTAVPDQEQPALVFNPRSVEYLLAWAESRLGGTDIRALRAWFPAMGPRPTPTPTLTPTPTVTPTPTLTPTATLTPRPTLPARFLPLILRNRPGE